MLISKNVQIKRINPKELKLVGDLILTDSLILVKFKWKKLFFPTQQIELIKAYSVISWGLEEYEIIKIEFSNQYQITLDGSLKEHQNLIESILDLLGLNNPKLSWGTLPKLDDKTGEDIIFKKNKIF